MSVARAGTGSTGGVLVVLSVARADIGFTGCILAVVCQLLELTLVLLEGYWR